MARMIQPPSPLPRKAVPSVFLAGSIDMGQAGDWQLAFRKALDDLDILILNPRRDQWDATWIQDITNDEFRAQVEWELAAQEYATFIPMYFHPATKAPITLLELGLTAHTGKAIVCCPPGFWRRGNVQVVCARYGITLVDELDELIQIVRDRITG